jgi:hypothetical protein
LNQIEGVNQEKMSTNATPRTSRTEEDHDAFDEQVANLGGALEAGRGAEERVRSMANRFQANLDLMLKDLNDERDDPTNENDPQNSGTSGFNKAKVSSKGRWKALKKTFVEDHGANSFMRVVKQLTASNREEKEKIRLASRTPDEIIKDLQEEEGFLIDFIADPRIPLPSIPEPQIVDEKLNYTSGPLQPVQTFIQEFSAQSDQVGIEVSKVPESVVEYHEEAMEEFVRGEQMRGNPNHNHNHNPNHNHNHNHNPNRCII